MMVPAFAEIVLEGCIYPGEQAMEGPYVDHTSIDYLDFASPKAGLGSKMGIDATNKWTGETDRQWGAKMDEKVRQKMNAIWPETMPSASDALSKHKPKKT